MSKGQPVDKGVDFGYGGKLNMQQEPRGRVKWMLHSCRACLKMKERISSNEGGPCYGCVSRIDYLPKRGK